MMTRLQTGDRPKALQRRYRSLSANASRCTRPAIAHSGLNGLMRHSMDPQSDRAWVEKMAGIDATS
jgi:hypothetical protein